MPIIKGAKGVTNDLSGMVAVQLTKAVTLSTSGENVVYGRTPGVPEIVVVPRNEAKHLPGFITTAAPAGLEAIYYMGAGA